MTAMSLIVQPQAAYLLTDTAYYLADGTVVKFAPKVTELHFGGHGGLRSASAAFALTGVVAPEHVAGELAILRADDIRGVMDALPSIVRKLSAQILAARRAPGVGDDDSMLLSLAMWDRATKAPYGFLIGNETCAPVLAGHMQPFTLTRMNHYVLARATKQPPDLNYADPKQFDPIAHGGDLLDDQRADPFGDNAVQFAGVGGSGVLTEITGAGVKYHMLRSWDDHVGQKIAA